MFASKLLSQREAATKITPVPLLVNFLLVLAQDASVIMLSADSSDKGHHDTG
jgi:hypothetical protein